MINGSIIYITKRNGYLIEKENTIIVKMVKLKKSLFILFVIMSFLMLFSLINKDKKTIKTQVAYIYALLNKLRIKIINKIYDKGFFV